MKLKEDVGLVAPKIDEERGVIEGVKILGLVSKNGRQYAQEALLKAQHLYENIGVNLDHTYKGQRRVADSFGRLKDVHIREDGLYGTLDYLKSHPFAKPFVESAKRMPEQLGLSHVAEGRTRREGDVETVESIDAVETVDLVRYPASTKGLFESSDTVRQQLARLCEDASLTDAQLKEQIMATVQATDKEDVAAIISEKVAEATEQLKTVVDVEAIAKTVVEKITDHLAKVDDATASLRYMECIYANDVDVLKLTAEQAQQLRSLPTIEEMHAFAESLPKFTRRGDKPTLPPKAGESRSYEQLREELESEYSFK